MNRILDRLAWVACSGLMALSGCGGEPAALAGATVGAGGERDDPKAPREPGGDRPGVPGGAPVTAAPALDCDALSAKLQAALDDAIAAQGIPGGVAAVDAGGCSFRGSAGVSDAAGMTPVAPADLFRAGSITKTFISTLVLMLRAEGKLSLDDAVSTYLPGLPFSERTTVRQLLNHTSGIFDFTSNDEFWSALAAEPTRVWTPEQLIAFAADEPPYFEPGEGFEYSNTNYVVAGLLAEAVSGVSLGDLLRARILDPGRLEHTYLGGEQRALPGLVRGYGRYGGELVDTTSAADISAVGAAGALVSSADDLNRFFIQLFNGDLLGPAELEEMTDWVETRWEAVPEYGLGLCKLDYPIGAAYGHDGGIWGFVASSYRAADSGAAITVLINLEVGDAKRIVSDLSNVLTVP